MSQFQLSQRSLLRLEGVHPALVAVVKLAIQRTNVDFTVVEGLRTPERQRELVAAGKSQTLNGLHLRQPDGYVPSTSRRWWMARYRGIAGRFSLTWPA